MIVQVIYHRADFDGLFSGAVCLHWLKFQGHTARLTGWDFGDPLIVPDFDAEKVFVVDLPPSCVGDPFPLNANMVWIDHHKSSIDKEGDVLPGYRIDGVAACRLAWQWFAAEYDSIHAYLAHKQEYADRQVKEPLALTLAGEYDVWDKRDPRGEQFQFGLTADGPWTPERLDGEFLGCFTDGTAHYSMGDMAAEKAAENGASAMKWQQAYARDVCENRGYSVNWEGQTFWCLASVHARNSMWFANDVIPAPIDALLCYRIEGDGQVKVSLYHRPGREDLDLSDLAVKHGGGGHRGACGFSLTVGQAIMEGILK